MREAARPAAAACASRVAAQQGLSSRRRRRRRRPPALPRPPTWGCPGSWTLQTAAEDACGAPEPAERAGRGVRSAGRGYGAAGGSISAAAGGPVGPVRPGLAASPSAVRPARRPNFGKFCVWVRLRARGASASGGQGSQASRPRCPPRGLLSGRHLRGPGVWRGAEGQSQGARKEERARPGWWRWVFEPLFKSLY